MDMENGCVLLVQTDLKKIVSFAQKCIEAGIDEKKIFATVYPGDIPRFLNAQGIGSIIIDSELYNHSSANTLRTCAQERDLNVLLVTSDRFKKTIRMMMDKNLRYISQSISSDDLAQIINYDCNWSYKKVVHM